MNYILICFTLGLVFGCVFTTIFIKKKKTIGKIISDDENSFYIELVDENSIKVIKESNIVILEVSHV